MLKFTNLRLLLSAMIVVLPASAAPKVVAVSVDSIIHPITNGLVIPVGVVLGAQSETS